MVDGYVRSLLGLWSTMSVDELLSVAAAILDWALGRGLILVLRSPSNRLDVGAVRRLS